MGESRNYVRTTISVHPDIKDQMDAVQEEVNWSAVASRAFENQLAEIAARKEKKDMKDIVTRLRASKRQAEDAQYKAGSEAGREWAGDTAEADDLQRLERWADHTRNDEDWDALFAQGNSRDGEIAEHVVSAIWADEEPDYYSVKEFWEQALGDDTSAKDDPSFVKGFVEGALALWDEVKNQL